MWNVSAAIEASQIMGNKIFVGGLSWDTTEEGLRTAFERFGEVVEAKVITDRDTGRSRGFGFVTFGDDSMTGAAIEGMDGETLDGRAIRVNEAQERSSGGGHATGKRHCGQQHGKVSTHVEGTPKVEAARACDYSSPFREL